MTKNSSSYILNNPLHEGLVFRPEEYHYSSGIDYSGEKAILDVTIKEVGEAFDPFSFFSQCFLAK